MIYWGSGSGSYSRKILVLVPPPVPAMVPAPVPAPVPPPVLAPVPVLDPDLFSIAF
jgi:hypothetical protein